MKLWVFIACMWPLSVVHAYSLKYTSTGGVVRWPSATSTVELRVDPALADFLPNGQALQAVYMAADAWRGFAGVPAIQVGEAAPPTYNPDQRGSGVYLVKPWTFEANRLAITVTSYYPSGELVGVDVLVNGDVDYALLPEGELDPDMRVKHDLGAVLTHEFGHVLGLDESEDDPAATMWPYIRSGETHQRTLSLDDEDALLDLYSAELESSVEDMGCGASVLGNRLGSRAGIIWSSILLVGIAVLRLRRRSAYQLPQASSPPPIPN